MMTSPEDQAHLDSDRSNKGASKQRRDQINAEISIMRDLLPLSESTRQRLSQLQVMSLVSVYIRKCNTLQTLFGIKHGDPDTWDSPDFSQALPGFLLVTTKEGKLLYISENVNDFLGHSMVDMKTQGDSVYDIIDKRDRLLVQAQLMSGHPEVSFLCRMNVSRALKRQPGLGDVKVMLVRGRFLTIGIHGDSQSVFMGVCCPLLTSDTKDSLVQNNTSIFKTVHKLDMSFLQVSKTGEEHLGASSNTLVGRSWYSCLHPEDIFEARDKHSQLIKAPHDAGCTSTLRMLRSDGSYFWVYSVLQLSQTSSTASEELAITCTSQVINAHEAYMIRGQGHMFVAYPDHPQELWESQMSPHRDPAALQWVTGCESLTSHRSLSGHAPGNCCLLTSLSLSTSGPAINLKEPIRKRIPPPVVKPQPPNKIRKLEDFDQSSKMAKMPEVVQQPLQSHIDSQNQPMNLMKPQLAANLYQTKPGHPSPYLPGSPPSGQLVPDSYLTPEPSPVSSPRSSHGDKVEAQIDLGKARAGTSPVSILAALENFATRPVRTSEKKTPVVVKELPVLDAASVEHFFEAITHEPHNAMKDQASRNPYEMVKKIRVDQLPAVNIPNFAALKDEPAGVYPTDVNHNQLHGFLNRPHPIQHDKKLENNGASVRVLKSPEMSVTIVKPLHLETGRSQGVQVMPASSESIQRAAFMEASQAIDDFVSYLSKGDIVHTKQIGNDLVSVAKPHQCQMEGFGCDSSLTQKWSKLSNQCYQNSSKKRNTVIPHVSMNASMQDIRIPTSFMNDSMQDTQMTTLLINESLQGRLTAISLKNGGDTIMALSSNISRDTMTAPSSKISRDTIMPTPSNIRRETMMPTSSNIHRETMMATSSKIGRETMMATSSNIGRDAMIATSSKISRDTITATSSKNDVARKSLLEAGKTMWSAHSASIPDNSTPVSLEMALDFLNAHSLFARGKELSPEMSGNQLQNFTFNSWIPQQGFFNTVRTSQ